MTDIKDHDAVATALIRGDSVKSSLMAGGYSEKAAKQGKARIPKAVTVAMARKLADAKDLGSLITAEEQENIVRGRLLMNSLQGKDSAVRSLELLGKDKRVNMFAQDSLTGVIVLNVPTSVSVIKPAEENEIL